MCCDKENTTLSIKLQDCDSTGLRGGEGDAGADCNRIQRRHFLPGQRLVCVPCWAGVTYSQEAALGFSGTCLLCPPLPSLYLRDQVTLPSVPMHCHTDWDKNSVTSIRTGQSGSNSIHPYPPLSVSSALSSGMREKYLSYLPSLYRDVTGLKCTVSYPRDVSEQHIVV